MILADTRHQLTRNDAELVARLIARDSGAELSLVEQTLADHGIDAVLDDPRLPAALLRSRQGACASLPLFAYVMVRHALRRLGEEDRLLADYLAALMLHFGLRDRAWRVGEADDQVYTTLAELFADVDDPDGRRSFLVRTHLGNYALWVSGFFPDHIEHRRWRKGGPDLDYFEAMGRRGFRLAADHRLAENHGMATLYATAAERFGLLRAALNDVSDALLFPDRHSPDRLMRQVTNEARWRRVS
ncbi:MAG: hypothetical protein HOQ17_09955 [Gemmatimonadaceae bacterium]|nr:hypothetical protein [Gemmatimonadaceae bacterium]NUO94812.1 hypothetical protein [Gemmatimonadaceae bacterium]NUP56318.1 hypothetical protein [Gemmatimonadaceae bacterium]NUP72892.1 hypothetical protein [Gemmatimonadaceae bacterium]NUR35644.1 hypothetical protein [Gemmatimonadaceae bacterium]